MQWRITIQKLKDISKRRKVILGVIIWALIVVMTLIFILLSTRIKVSYCGDRYGRMDIYYDSDDVHNVFSSDKVISEYLINTDGSYADACVYIKPGKINNLKFTFSGYKVIQIEGLYVEGILGTKIRLGNEHFSTIFQYVQCNPVFDKSSMTLYFDSSDNEIIGMDLNIMGAYITQALKRAILVGTAIVVLVLIVIATLKLFNNDTLSRKYKTFQVYGAFISILCVVFCIIFCFDRINLKKIETSTVITDMGEEIWERNYSEQIRIYGDELLGVMLEGVPQTFGDGKIEFLLEDKEFSEVVMRKEYADISVLANGSVSVDLRGSGLEKGRDYLASFNFKSAVEDANEDIYCNLRLTQFYKFNYRSYAKWIIILVGIVYFVFLIVMRRKRIEYHFLMISLLVGVFFVFIIPPYSGSDEIRHFLRAYAMCSEKAGEIEKTENYVGSGNGGAVESVSVPKGISELRILDNGLEYDNQTYKAERSERVFWDKYISQYKPGVAKERENVSLWGVMTLVPISYLPQMIFICIAEMLEMLPIGVFYMARIGNLLACVLIIFGALKVVPDEYKMFIVLAAFVPNMLNIRSTCTLDGLLYSAIVFFLADIMRVRKNRICVLNLKEIVLLVLPLCLIVITKIPYILVIFLFILLKKENFQVEGKRQRGKKYNKYLKWGFIVFVGVIIVAGYLSRDYIFRGVNIIGGKHYNYVLQYPIRFTKLFLEFMFMRTIPYIFSGISLKGNGMISIAYIGICVLYCTKGPVIDSFFRKIAGNIALLICIALFFVGYSISQYNSGVIQGITGRYYTPIVPLLLLTICTTRKNKLINTQNFQVSRAMHTLIYCYMCMVFMFYWM